MKRISLGAIFGVLALALIMATNAQATVTMTLVDATSHAETSGSFTAYLGANQIINGNDLIGLYNFNINPGSVPSLGGSSSSSSGSLWATCVSPAGSLDWGTHTYDVLNFAQAGTGRNPAAWQPGGIQNADYLFTTLSGGILSGGIGGQAGTVQDQGAALALAMYASLYNSVAQGQVTGNAFYIPGLTSGNVYDDYMIDLGLVAGDKNWTAPAGYLLRSYPNVNAAGAGQDQIFLASALPNGYNPVPELSTVYAGALMLLPFGVSALRIVRRKCAA